MPDLDLDALDPGIRRRVAWLREHGFTTTDSGDGKTKVGTMAVRLAGRSLRIACSVLCVVESATEWVPMPIWLFGLVNDAAWWCGETAERIAPTPEETERRAVFRAFMDQEQQKPREWTR